MKKYKFLYVYIITNTVLNKQYVGSHVCYKDSIENDGYWGSSKYLNKDYKIYGKENFKKEILKYNCKNKKHLLDEETKFILRYNTLSPNGYNKFLPNKRYGFHSYGSKLSENHKLAISNAQKNKVVSAETRDKLSKLALGRKLSEEQIEKRKISQTGLHRSNETKERMRHSHKKFSDEGRKNISESHKGKFSEKQLAAVNKIVKCKFCGKETSSLSHNRWHGDNCKHKPLR
jgi:hypothetical protein